MTFTYVATATTAPLTSTPVTSAPSQSANTVVPDAKHGHDPFGGPAQFGRGHGPGDGPSFGHQGG
jgi:hypothetical protein